LLHLINKVGSRSAVMYGRPQPSVKHELGPETVKSKTKSTGNAGILQ
jgi:hypothetical protein